MQTQIKVGIQSKPTFNRSLKQAFLGRTQKSSLVSNQCINFSSEFLSQLACAMKNLQSFFES